MSAKRSISGGIYLLPNLLTTANLVLGCIVIALLFDRAEQAAMICSILIIVAGVLDYSDGLIARLTNTTSRFGLEYDSLADIVSFGVAPAVLGFTLGLRGVWDALILIYFVACGISRLARFNVTAPALSGPTGKVKYYEGTPIPTSLIIVIILGIAFWQGRIDDLILLGSLRIGPWPFHPFTILYAVSGSLMISSTLRIPKP